ncbi:hypothetical protein DXG01_014876 [Tephrocybe rancida]|nr:hypothetical protein DXG01_014876 [Tephrocybe rancida]
MDYEGKMQGAVLTLAQTGIEGGAHTSNGNIIGQHVGPQNNYYQNHADLVEILFSAAKKGVASVVEEALDYGAPINVRDEKGRTPLSRAAAKGHESVVQVLLRRPGVDFDGNTDGCYIPLHIASSNGHAKVVQLLTENGAPINVGDQWGASALYWASANGHEGVVQVLLRQPGVDFDGNTDGNYIPLHVASRNGHTAVVELLTENGAPINARDQLGATALYSALVKGHHGVVQVLLRHPGVDFGGNADGAYIPLHNASSKGDTKMVQLLTENGAPINVRDRWGATALYRASANGHEGVVQVLLRQPGVDFGGNTDGYHIPLHNTSSEGRTKMVRLLIENGAPINVRDQWGATALYQASANGHEEVVQVLLRQPGLDFDGNTDGDYVPLHDASSRGHTKMVQLLIENGAPINVKNKWGATALYRASANGHEGVPGVDFGGNTDGICIPLHNASSNGDTKMVQLLTENGVPINTRDQWGKTALYRASANGHEGVVQVLLHQPDIDVNGSNDGGIPLHIALSKGHTNVVQLLTDHLGLDVNAKLEPLGKTALHRAASSGHGDVVRTLFGHPNIMVNLKDGLQCTPLYLAASNNHSEVVAQLLHNRDIDVNLGNDSTSVKPRPDGDGWYHPAQAGTGHTIAPFAVILPSDNLGLKCRQLIWKSLLLSTLRFRWYRFLT